MTPVRFFLAIIVIVASATYVLIKNHPSVSDVAVEAKSAQARKHPATSSLSVRFQEANFGACSQVGFDNVDSDSVGVEMPKGLALSFFSDAACTQPIKNLEVNKGHVVAYFISRVLRDEVFKFATSEGFLMDARLITRRDRKLNPTGTMESAHVVSRSGKAGVMEMVDFSSAYDESISSHKSVPAFFVQPTNMPFDVAASGTQVCMVDQTGVQCASKTVYGSVTDFVPIPLPTKRIYDIDGGTDATMCAATDRGVFCWKSPSKVSRIEIDSTEPSIGIVVRQGDRMCGLAETGKISCLVSGTSYVLLRRAKEIFKDSNAKGALTIEGLDSKIYMISDSNSSDKPFCEIANAKDASEIVTFTKQRKPCEQGCMRRGLSLSCWRTVANGTATPEDVADFL